MLAYLKVKCKSLAAEARIIRHEERKFLASARWLRKKDPGTNHYAPDGPHLTWSGLRAHRLDLRLEQRSAYLAYGYLRGMPYRRIERDAGSLPDHNRICELVWKFGPTPRPQGGQKEKDAAKKLLLDAIKAWLETPLPQTQAA